ncbi:MAG: hypothetical protein LBL58_09620 [Tannerellaceae bacterium]|jgi:hypothetical protein|nr:hypothetical protein [Tannerellaceae bacterium]
MEDNPLITMLEEKVGKFKQLIGILQTKQLYPEEQQAFYALKNYWKRNDFNAERCNVLLKTLADFNKKHPVAVDLELTESLQEFRRLCYEYYTKDKAVFEAFQTALGGKKKPKPRPKAHIKSEPMENVNTTPEPKSEPKPESESQPAPDNTVISGSSLFCYAVICVSLFCGFRGFESLFGDAEDALMPTLGATICGICTVVFLRKSEKKFILSLPFIILSIIITVVALVETC